MGWRIEGQIIFLRVYFMVQHLQLLETFDNEAFYTETCDATSLIYVVTLNPSAVQFDQAEAIKHAN